MGKKTDESMTWPKGYTPKDESDDGLNIRHGLLSSILKERPKKKFNTEIFNVMAKRRSTRKFSRNPVEMWKIDKILAGGQRGRVVVNLQ